MIILSIISSHTIPFKDCILHGYWIFEDNSMKKVALLTRNDQKYLEQYCIYILDERYEFLKGIEWLRNSNGWIEPKPFYYEQKKMICIVYNKINKILFMEEEKKDSRQSQNIFAI